MKMILFFIIILCSRLNVKNQTLCNDMYTHVTNIRKAPSTLYRTCTLSTISSLFSSHCNNILLSQR